MSDVTGVMEVTAEVDVVVTASEEIDVTALEAVMTDVVETVAAALVELPPAERRNTAWLWRTCRARRPGR